jgi:hypothetical protein
MSSHGTEISFRTFAVICGMIPDSRLRRGKGIDEGQPAVGVIDSIPKSVHA